MIIGGGVRFDAAEYGGDTLNSLTLERAHQVSHALQAAIRNRLGDADVLIHLEPEDAADRAARERRLRAQP